MSWLSNLAPIGGAILGNLIVPGAGGLIGGAIAGSAVSSAVDASQAIKAGESANASNVDYARETNATSIELANTAHQREIADLKAAGLNPILSAKYGGSTTPALKAPSVESLAPTILSSGESARNAMSSGVGMALQAQVQQSQVALNSASAVKAGQEARRLAMENDVLEVGQKGRKAKAISEGADWTVRASRPNWMRAIGVTGSDFFQGLNPLKGWVK